jgi:DNA repair ATPase RecN
MLVNLHVKNLALIEEENIDFDEGLNILSGETGAGKSIILGSINAARKAEYDKAYKKLMNAASLLSSQRKKTALNFSLQIQLQILHQEN